MVLSSPEARSLSTGISHNPLHQIRLHPGQYPPFFSDLDSRHCTGQSSDSRLYAVLMIFKDVQRDSYEKQLQSSSLSTYLCRISFHCRCRRSDNSKPDMFEVPLTPLLFQSQNLVKAVSNPLQTLHISMYQCTIFCKHEHLKCKRSGEYRGQENDIATKDRAVNMLETAPILDAKDLLVNAACNLQKLYRQLLKK